MKVSERKTNRWPIILMLIIIVGLFISLVVDFAALHDIHNEYLSRKILETLEVTLPKKLPAWTENKGEWDYLTLSLIAKGIGFSVLLAIALRFYRKESRD